MLFIEKAYAVDIGEKWPLKENFDNLGSLVSFIVPKILIIGSVVFFVMIVLAGLTMISKAGSADAQASEKAKNFLTYSILGLIIMFGAYWILQIINYITGGTLGSVGIL